MISWSIDAAKKSDCFDRIIVSTDDDEIASIAKRCGAEVPFKRPAELADDYATTQAVVEHGIKWLRKTGVEPIKVCCTMQRLRLFRTET